MECHLQSPRRRCVTWGRPVIKYISTIEDLLLVCRKYHACRTMHAAVDYGRPVTITHNSNTINFLVKNKQLICKRVYKFVGIYMSVGKYSIKIANSTWLKTMSSCALVLGYSPAFSTTFLPMILCKKPRQANKLNFHRCLIKQPSHFNFPFVHSHCFTFFITNLIEFQTSTCFVSVLRNNFEISELRRFDKIGTSFANSKHRTVIGCKGTALWPSQPVICHRPGGQIEECCSSYARRVLFFTLSN